MEHPRDTEEADSGEANAERGGDSPVPASPYGDPVALLDDAHLAACRAERERLRAIVECDRRQLWRNRGCRDHAEFLAGRFGISTWKARRWIGAAYALEHLPLTSHALVTGVLSLDKVVEVTRFATPATEKKLISWARRVRPAAIRARADAATRRSLARVPQAESDRHLKWWWHLDGTGLEIEGRLAPKEGATFIAAVDRVASGLPDAPPPEERSTSPDTCTIDQRRADALALLCSGRLANDRDPDRACVVIHAPYESLISESANAEIVGGPAIHPRTAQRLACDGRLEVALHGCDDEVVGVGRASREPPRWLRRLVLRRDSHTCTFPGCGMRRFLHTHHIHWWDFGGRTDLENLVTVCTFHHKLVHEYGWRVELRGCTPIWFRPSGRRFEPGPAPPRSVEQEAQPAASSDRSPWPALWHLLHSRDHEITKDRCTSRFLKYGARMIETGRLGDGYVHLLRPRDDAEGVLLADDAALA